jgi:glycosyltransferase involved in cell wall biosynthesis
VRIAHVTTLHPPRDVRIFEKEARTLAAAGHDVHIVAPGGTGEDADVHFHDLGASTDPGLRNLFARLRAANRLARSLRADAYHLHDSELIPLALLLRLTGRRVVYDAHEDTPREVIAMHPERPLIGRLLSLVWTVAERIGSLSGNAVVAATPSIASRFPRRKTVVVRNFPTTADTVAFAGGPHVERPANVVYLGGVTMIRGAYEMAAAIVRVREPSARLVLAGRFDVAVEGERIEVLGWLPRDGVAAVLREARVGLLVLHPVRAHLESLPIKLFEYLAAGIPVVASDFPLWRELIGDAGILVDPLDANAIAAAVETLLADPAEAERMGARGREAVLTRFSWEREAETLLDLYERLAS